MQIVAGADHVGDLGVVTHTENGKAEVMLDATEATVNVLVNNLTGTSDTRTGLETFGRFRLYQLVMLVDNEVGLIVRISASAAELLMAGARPRFVRPLATAPTPRAAAPPRVVLSGCVSASLSLRLSLSLPVSAIHQHGSLICRFPLLLPILQAARAAGTKLRTVKQPDIRRPMDGSKRAAAPDALRQAVSARSLVEIVDGKHKGKVARVEHVHKPHLWLHCQDVTQVCATACAHLTCGYRARGHCRGMMSAVDHVAIPLDVCAATTRWSCVHGCRGRSATPRSVVRLQRQRTTDVVAEQQHHSGLVSSRLLWHAEQQQHRGLVSSRLLWHAEQQQHRGLVNSRLLWHAEQRVHCCHVEPDAPQGGTVAARHASADSKPCAALASASVPAGSRGPHVPLATWVRSCLPACSPCLPPPRIVSFDQRGFHNRGNSRPFNERSAASCCVRPYSVGSTC